MSSKEVTAAVMQAARRASGNTSGPPSTASTRRQLRRSNTENIDTGSLAAARRFDFGVSPDSKHGKHFAVASAKRTPGDASTSSCSSTPHVIAMVGLPARGKTYISKKLNRYLNWIGVETKVINLGDYRRKCSHYDNHSLFSPDNPEGLKIRNQVCDEGLTDAIKYLEEEDGEVVIFDATNTTRDRRKLLHDRVVKEKGFKLFFVESVCDDQSIIESNIRSVKVCSPDYVGFGADDVVADFRKRIQHYEAQYETLDEDLEDELSFMKIFDAGKKVLVHKHEGHIQSRIVYYLMNINLKPRTIYLTRHGESTLNVQMKLGGDGELTNRGKEYAVKLADFMNGLQIDKLLVWTSFLRRTIQTAKHVKGIHESWKTLNELDVGVCDGLTYEEVKERYPEEFKARDVKKYTYRYPMGESYEDLVARLEPVIMELERQGSVLVISHQAVLRCILAYFMEVDENELPYLEVPMHTIIELSPRAYGCDKQIITMPVTCVNTHRPKPAVPGNLAEEFRDHHIAE